MGRPKKLSAEQAALPAKPPDCPDCRVPLRQPDHFCESCRAYWAYQVLHRATDTWDRKWGVEPRRACPLCGHEVAVLDGYCDTCEEYRAPRLVYKAWTNRAGTWVLIRWKEIPWDPALDRRCTKAENLAGLAACKAAVKGKAGPMAKAVGGVLEEVPF